MNKRELYEALRYQVLTPPVTTMGPCANGCGMDARGARECKLCLARQLADKTGSLLAIQWVSAMQNARYLEAMLEGALDEG